MRALSLLLITLILSGCDGLVYKLATRQGNVLEQKQLDQLQPGMTREQVKFLLGTPVAVGPFRDDRWDYVGYYKSPRGEVSNRTVTIHFENDQVARIDGAKGPTTDSPKGAGSVDVKAELSQEAKEKNEDTRYESEKNRDTGIVIKP